MSELSQNTLSTAAQECTTCIGQEKICGGSGTSHVHSKQHINVPRAHNGYICIRKQSFDYSLYYYQPHTRVTRPRGKRGRADASLCADRLVAILGHSMGAFLKLSLFCLSLGLCGYSMAAYAGRTTRADEARTYVSST